MHERAETPSCLVEALMGRNESSEAVAQAEAKLLSLHQALDTYLTWNGVHGYTNDILTIIQAFLPPEVINGVACGYVAVTAEGDVCLRTGHYSPASTLPARPPARLRKALGSDR